MHNSMSFQCFSRAELLETELTLKFSFFVYLFMYVILCMCLKTFVALDTSEWEWFGHRVCI